MPSPSKRRKKSSPVTSRQSRNLDFFFGKQRQAAAQPKAAVDGASEGLTDEEYARKLAEQWAKEDETRGSNAGGPSNTTITGVKKRKLSSSKATETSGLEQQQQRQLSATGGEVGDGQEAREIPPSLPQLVGTGKQAVLSVPPAPKKTAAVLLDAASDSDILIEEMPFDTDPLQFDPDIYGSLVAKWPNGKAPYGLLTRAFVLVNSTRSRIRIVDTLVNLIRTLIRLDPDSLLDAVGLPGR